MSLKPGAPLVMVNDNVRYQGANVPVDLILSDIASQLGFDVERIWVLPRGKGNSSQQMGKHGRAELRKCVYVWRRLRTNTQEHGNAGQGTARRASEGIRRVRRLFIKGLRDRDLAGADRVGVRAISRSGVDRSGIRRPHGHWPQCRQRVGFGENRLAHRGLCNRPRAILRREIGSRS